MIFEAYLVGVAVLLILSIGASKAARQLGIPALLLFLLIGMLAGSDGPGGLYFDDYALAQSVGVVALTFILFAGGLDTHWPSVRPMLSAGMMLATIGVLLTALLVGCFAVLVLRFSFLEGLLLGAIVSSTDAAAVFAVLRGRDAQLPAPLGPLIELESGSNDPMAVFLTTGLVQLLVTPTTSSLDLIGRFVQQMLVGAVLGVGFGRGMLLLINKSHLEYEGLYPVLSIALVLLTYGLTTLLGGNGFLAVYVAGLLLGNSNFVHRGSILRFHDGIAWLMQITMFLVLGLLVFPSHLVPIVGTGLLCAVFLMLVARPVGVFVSLAWLRLPWRAKALVGWVGLRGAVPIILATFPLLAGVPRAETIFNLVFFIVLTSVLVQGTTLPHVVRWLGLSTPPHAPQPYHQTFVPAIDLGSQVSEISVLPASPAVGKSILELGLPTGALVALIARNDATLVPNGGTVLQVDDTLVVVARPDVAAVVRTQLGVSAAPQLSSATPPEDAAVSPRPYDP